MFLGPVLRSVLRSVHCLAHKDHNTLKDWKQGEIVSLASAKLNKHIFQQLQTHTQNTHLSPVYTSNVLSTGGTSVCVCIFVVVVVHAEQSGYV